MMCRETIRFFWDDLAQESVLISRLEDLPRSTLTHSLLFRRIFKAPQDGFEANLRIRLQNIFESVRNCTKTRFFSACFCPRQHFSLECPYEAYLS